MNKWLVGVAAGVGAAVAAQALLRREDDDALQGQVALITGGSRGLACRWPASSRGAAAASPFARATPASWRQRKRDLERRGARS